MKRVIYLIALLMPMVINAMKIQTDETDEFTGKRTVITSWESLCKGYTHIRFRLQNDVQWLDFKFINDNSIVIGKDDKLLFKSTDDNITTFLSASLYSGGRGDGAVGLSGSQAWGISASYEGDLSWFATNSARLFRLYTTNVYYDRKLSEGDGKKLTKLYELFSQTISGEKGISTFSNYKLKFVKRKVSSQEWDIEKEEYLQDQSASEIKDIIDEWKSKSSDKYIYDVQVKKEK